MPSLAASSAPSTTVPGPRSPPMASTATRTVTGLEAGAERLDVAALVRLAVRAHAMRDLRLPAGRADVHPRSFDAVLGAALVAAGLAGLFLGDCHRRRSIASLRLRLASGACRTAPAATAGL